MNSTKSSSPNLILLIFALCGNIRSLEVSGCPYIWAIQAKRHGIVKQARKMKDALSAGVGSLFMDIQHVNLINDGSTETSLTKSHLSVFLDLPHIQTLTTDYLGPGDRGPDSFEYYPYSSSVKEIRVENFQAEMADLSCILSTCDRIEVLSIEFAIASDAHRRLDWGELGDGLIDPHSTLKTLRLGYDAPTTMEDLGYTEHDMYDFDESDFEDEIMGIKDEDDTMNAPLRPLHDLQRKQRLSHLTLTENALCGRTPRSDRWDSDGEYGGSNGECSDSDGEYSDCDNECSDSDEDEPTIPRFAELLPPSLTTLTISCEDNDIRRKAKAFLSDPYASRLDDMVVMNVQKSHWFSKANGEGGMDPAERRRRRREDAVRRAQASRRTDAFPGIGQPGHAVSAAVDA